MFLLKGDYPYYGRLDIDNTYLCGASLISCMHLVTAAHCTDGASFITVSTVFESLEGESPWVF